MIIIQAILLYTATISCKKDKNEEPTIPVPQLLTITNYYNGAVSGVRTIHYDANGRYVKSTLNNGSYDTIEYSNPLVLWKSYDAKGILTGIETYNINSDGLAIFNSSDKKRDKAPIEPLQKNMNFTKEINDAAFEYDANGYLVKQTDYNYFTSLDTTITIFHIVNGNISGKSVSSSSSYIEEMTFSFTYLPDRPNTIGYQNTGIFFLGKQSKNLLEYIIFKTALSNPDTIKYKYGFDSKNRVIMQIQSMNSIIMATSFTYKE
jgi:hypothetical protein